MPYIEPHVRGWLSAGDKPLTAGELNFAITNYLVNECEQVEYPSCKAWVIKMVNDYIVNVHHDRLTYAAINDVNGVLTCAAHEALRRDAAEWISDLLYEVSIEWYMHHAGPYEDMKIQEHGDVYP